MKVDHELVLKAQLIEVHATEVHATEEHERGSDSSSNSSVPDHIDSKGL